MQWKRLNNKERAEVVSEKINNPSLSTRDIGEKTWINHRTVARVLKEEMSQVVAKSYSVVRLIDENNNLISIVNHLIQARIKDSPELLSIRDLILIRDWAFRQNTLLEFYGDRRDAFCGYNRELDDFEWEERSRYAKVLKVKL